MNGKEAVKRGGIFTIITVFITMMILTFLEFSMNSMIAVYCSVMVFFAINLAALMFTRKRKIKTRVIVLVIINVAAVAALVLLLKFVLG
jgi:amino acid transporter